MKLLLVIILFGSFSANAKDTLYCKVNKRAANALESVSDGWSYNEYCQEPLLSGDVCFTGSRTKIIERLNLGNRVGSDEDWIEGARYNGRNLQYTVVDGPNEWEEKYIIKKCTPAFFRNSEPEQLPLFPGIEEKKDLEALQAYLNTENVGNGDAGMVPYLVSSLQIEVSKMLASHREASRDYQEDSDANDAYFIDHEMRSTASNLVDWMELSETNPENVTEDFKPLLDRMIEKGVVLKIISVGPPESCYDPTYCRWQLFNIFLSNGEHYYINFDFTT